MKNIKPIYIYLFGIIIAIAAFFVISSNNSTDKNLPLNNIANKEMPQDSIHKALMNGEKPGKDNVMASVMKRMEKLKKAVEENPRDTVKLKQYADFLAVAHQPEESLIYYNKILKINPKRVDILFSEAYLKYSTQKYDDAENILNKIISIDKTNLKAYYNLGAIEVTKGNKTKAKEIWSKLAKEHPGTEIGKLAKQSLSKI